MCSSVHVVSEQNVYKLLCFYGALAFLFGLKYISSTLSVSFI